jgi:hypothetical protein
MLQVLYIMVYQIFSYEWHAGGFLVSVAIGRCPQRLEVLFFPLDVVYPCMWKANLLLATVTLFMV